MTRWALHAPRPRLLPMLFLLLTAGGSGAVLGPGRFPAFTDDGPPVRLTARDTTLRAVAEAVARTTGVVLRLPAAWADDRVSIVWEDVPLVEAVRRLLGGRSYLMRVRAGGRWIDVDPVGVAEGPLAASPATIATGVVVSGRPASEASRAGTPGVKLSARPQGVLTPADDRLRRKVARDADLDGGKVVRTALTARSPDQRLTALQQVRDGGAGEALYDVLEVAAHDRDQQVREFAATLRRDADTAQTEVEVPPLADLGPEESGDEPPPPESEPAAPSTRR